LNITLTLDIIANDVYFLASLLDECDLRLEISLHFVYGHAIHNISTFQILRRGQFLTSYNHYTKIGAKSKVVKTLMESSTYISHVRSLMAASMRVIERSDHSAALAALAASALAASALAASSAAATAAASAAASVRFSHITRQLLPCPSASANGW
jgi:hypothetical protein